MRSTLVLAALLIAAAACSPYQEVSILRAWSPAGGLTVEFDHPCPEGGPIEIEVEETETQVVVAAIKSEGQLIDCDGGAAASDVSTIGIELDSPLRDRIVIDGWTGQEVAVIPGPRP